MVSNDTGVCFFLVCVSAHYKLLCNVLSVSLLVNYMNMHLPIVTLFTNTFWYIVVDIAELGFVNVRVIFGELDEQAMCTRNGRQS